MEVKVDKNICIGCGTCAAIAGEVFEMTAEGKAQVKAGDQTANEALANQAKDSCPVQAISVV